MQDRHALRRSSYIYLPFLFTGGTYETFISGTGTFIQCISGPRNRSRTHSGWNTCSRCLFHYEMCIRDRATEVKAEEKKVVEEKAAKTTAKKTTRKPACKVSTCVELNGLSVSVAEVEAAVKKAVKASGAEATDVKI